MNVSILENIPTKSFSNYNFTFPSKPYAISFQKNVFTKDKVNAFLLANRRLSKRFLETKDEIIYFQESFHKIKQSKDKLVRIEMDNGINYICMGCNPTF